MVLLVQIYAPLTEEDCETLSDPESSFHRILYVFCCKEGKCHNNNNADQQQLSQPKSKEEIISSKIIGGLSNAFVVIRSQLPENNRFYKYSEKDDLWIFNKNEKKSNTCEICGLFASKRCSACGSVYYCCRDHQLLDWNLGHEKQCKILKSKTTTTTTTTTNLPEKRKSHVCFDEFELTTEPEIFTQQQHKDILKEEVKEEREKAKETLISKIDEDDKFERVEKDATFLRFQKKISPFKDQVMRYYNSHNRTKKSLIVSKEGLITDFPNMPPPCELCGSPRQLEFQVSFSLFYFIFFFFFKFKKK